MGNNQSNKYPGYTLVKSKDEQKILVKNEKGDQFVVKKLSTRQENDVNFLLNLDHPHIVHHKEIIRDGDSLYVVLDLCEGGDLAEKIKHSTGQFSEKEILDWIVQICMALKYLHDQQILHKNLQPKSLLFTACGTIRLGEFDKWFTDAQAAESESRAYAAPEIISGKRYDEKSEIWRLGCVICELCTLKRAFSARNSDEIDQKILRSSYENLPPNFSEDLHELIKDTLQVNPAGRPSVSEILMRPFIFKHLKEMSTQIIEELNTRLDELRTLASELEKVHFNTTVGSLSGGVVGLVGGILSVVGLALTPVTLGASLIVTGVGIGIATAGGVASGVSNVTKMVNQRSNRQKIKMIITLFQEKITSISCCIQNIKIAMETLQKEFSTNRETFLNGTSAGARLGRGLGGIAELIRLIEVVNIGKVAAQAARAVRAAEAATGVLSALFIVVDIFFVFLDSREIHNIRKYKAFKESQQKSKSACNQTTSNAQTSDNSDKTNLLPSNTQEEELKSETMKFVTKIKETTEELQTVLDTLQEALKLTNDNETFSHKPRKQMIK